MTKEPSDIGSQAASSRWIGRSISRREDYRLIAGSGRYVADLVDASTLQVAFVRSTEAAARITSIETGDAAASTGVVSVITGEDLAGKLGGIEPLHIPDPVFSMAVNFYDAHPDSTCLPTTHVTYVGQPVVMVIARSRAEAEDACELVDINYEPYAPVVNVDEALAADSRTVHPELGDNRAASLEAGFGDIEAAREEAAHVVELELKVGRHGGVPLETRGVLAEWDQADGRLHVWTSTQIPHMVKTAIRRATGWLDREIRVTAPDVGGGFGPKANVYPEELLIAYSSRLLKRRIAWIEDRSEHLISTAQGRDQRLCTRMDLDENGIIKAWSLSFVADVGAGSLWVAGIVANTALHALGPYKIPAYHVQGVAAYTNKTIVAQYRGAGRPEACFALERSLDAAADRVGVSRVEIRRRNILQSSDLPHAIDLPYRDGVPITYDGSHFGLCMEKALEVISDARVNELEQLFPNLLVGRGIANYVEATGRGPYEGASVLLTSDGTFDIGSGAASAGQGHETTLAQIAADALGVELAQIDVRNGDTDYVPFGVGTFASRSAVVAGSAIHEACIELRNQARKLAAEFIGVAPGDVQVDETGVSSSQGSLSWAQLASELTPGGRLARHGPLHVRQTWSPETVTWTMGTHAAVVGIDPCTGRVRVLDYAVVHEGGREINPQVVHGQVQGGVAQGIGGALLEEFVYGDDGQPRTASFAEYLLPGTHEVPDVKIEHVTGRAELNPISVKGVGESGTIPVYSVLASAVEDATGSDGGVVVATPIQPAHVRNLVLQESR